MFLIKLIYILFLLKTIYVNMCRMFTVKPNTSFLNIFFLRSCLLFVKNKYSRNRQWSKSIIYFGVYLNILLIFLTLIYNYHYLYNFIFFYCTFIILYYLNWRLVTFPRACDIYPIYIYLL